MRCPNMTAAEYRTAFSIWVLGASPLMIDADIRNMSDTQRQILLHPEMLDLHHDPAARGGSRVGVGGCNGATLCDTHVWAKPLAGNATAVGLYNGGHSAAHLSFAFSLLGYGAESRLAVRDVWGQEDLGLSVGEFRTRQAVEPHGTAVLKIFHSRQ